MNDVNDIIVSFIANLDNSIKRMREILTEAQINKNTLNTIRSVSNKLTDGILSLAQIKDYEFNILKKKLCSVEDIINEIELLRYLALGIVNLNIKIEFTNKQIENYKLFKKTIGKENAELNKYDLAALKEQMESTDIILKMLKTGKPRDYDRNVLNTIFNGFVLDIGERNVINTYICSINNKKNTK